MTLPHATLGEEYRKKPVVIRAKQWFKNGDHPEVKPQNHQKGVPGWGWIWTLESSGQGHVVTPGDWIIQGVKGEFYACKPDIFEATYEPASTVSETLTNADYEEVLADHRRLVRELDVMFNGEDGAAPQASLCDLVAQLKSAKQREIDQLKASVSAIGERDLATMPQKDLLELQSDVEQELRARGTI